MNPVTVGLDKMCLRFRTQELPFKDIGYMLMDNDVSFKPAVDLRNESEQDAESLIAITER